MNPQSKCQHVRKCAAYSITLLTVLETKNQIFKICFKKEDHLTFFSLKMTCGTKNYNHIHIKFEFCKKVLRVLEIIKKGFRVTGIGQLKTYLNIPFNRLEL